MAKRSLQASPEGIEQAKKSFTRKGWTQDNLAGEVNLKTRQPIWRFFSGQRIERWTFIEVCTVLELDWREIAIDPPAEFGEVAEATVLDIDTLVKQVRTQCFEKIKNQCGILQLLDVSRPVSIDDIYIDINISEEIASLQWLEFADLQSFTSKEFDRFGLGELSHTQITGIRAVEIYSKLRVLGKAGAGKTTFLQHLGIQCQRGIFAANRVPIFVILRDFANEERESWEFNLLNYIRKALVVQEPSLQKCLTCASQKSLAALPELKNTICKHQNIQHHCQFSPERQEVLEQYYYANQLLNDCLNSNCQVTDVVRQKIEASLLLPIKEFSQQESMAGN